MAWQKAFEVGLDIYDVSKQFPNEERYGLTSQIRRSSISVASNIAEGYGRQRTAEYLRFLRIARGSLYEVETQLEFARVLEFVREERADRTSGMIAECERVLAGLIRSIESSRQ